MLAPSPPAPWLDVFASQGERGREERCVRAKEKGGERRDVCEKRGNEGLRRCLCVCACFVRGRVCVCVLMLLLVN